jgi:hypothetical protein
MLIFTEGGKPEKNPPRSKRENQQQTQLRKEAVIRKLLNKNTVWSVQRGLNTAAHLNCTLFCSIRHSTKFILSFLTLYIEVITRKMCNTELCIFTSQFVIFSSLDEKNTKPYYTTLRVIKCSLYDRWQPQVLKMADLNESRIQEHPGACNTVAYKVMLYVLYKYDQ